MPDPLSVSPKLYDNPSFMPRLYQWGAEGGEVPDVRELGQEPDYLMKILSAMLGPTGYMQYKKALDKQRKAREGYGPPTPTPMPMPSPTPIGDPLLDEARRLAGGS